MTVQTVSAIAPSILTRTDPGEAVIVGADIAAGHDGSAEMVLSVQYENGVVSALVLDQRAGLDVMHACGAASLDALVGRPWREISKNLTAEER
jgi:hypothetical protein